MGETQSTAQPRPRIDTLGERHSRPDSLPSGARPARNLARSGGPHMIDGPQQEMVRDKEPHRTAGRHHRQAGDLGKGAASRRLTASSYAARRLGLRPFILGHLGRPGTNALPPASRVSISELLGRTMTHPSIGVHRAVLFEEPYPSQTSPETATATARREVSSGKPSLGSNTVQRGRSAELEVGRR